MASPERICSVDGCERAAHCRGWCKRHYERWRTRGRTELLTFAEKFWARVEREVPDGCWQWTGAKNRDGYGNVRRAGRVASAHVVAFQLLVGPVPEGLEIDHLCRNRACVNPAHLEPVPHRTNVLRGDAPPAANARKTHCIRGHNLTDPANVYNMPSGGRRCRVCYRMVDAARQPQRRARA